MRRIVSDSVINSRLSVSIIDFCRAVGVSLFEFRESLMNGFEIQVQVLTPKRPSAQAIMKALDPV